MQYYNVCNLGCVLSPLAAPLAASVVTRNCGFE